jgi:hypothetical protein
MGERAETMEQRDLLGRECTVAVERFRAALHPGHLFGERRE